MRVIIFVSLLVVLNSIDFLWSCFIDDSVPFSLTLLVAIYVVAFAEYMVMKFKCKYKKAMEIMFATHCEKIA